MLFIYYSKITNIIDIFIIKDYFLKTLVKIKKYP